MSPDSDSSSASEEFPVVGIGASAGGLQAVKAFLGSLPAHSGMALVLVMHLSPDRESRLGELLGEATPMLVRTVTEPVELAPDYLYVIAPETRLEIEKGRMLVPERREQGVEPTHPIDRFFRSLAREVGSRSVAIVLSGSGSDGSRGVREVNQQNGLVLVQEPDEASFSSMPESAISVITPDMTLPAAELGKRLAQLFETARQVHLPDDAEKLRMEDADAFQKLLVRLKQQTGHDFASYKPPTMLRRMSRRMQINGYSSLSEYLEYAREHAEELEILYEDLLIPVTSFLRDPNVFDYIDSYVIPDLFKGKEADDQIRVWVPACSTGEEAYSYALLLNEHTARRTDTPEIQLFATDLNETAVRHAREGQYPETVAEEVDDRLLARYFRREDSSLVVKPEVRDQIVFAEHDLLSDPPFARLDLISCRNLLIYLKPEQQERVLQICHFALRNRGWLVLGSSESGETSSGLFGAEDQDLSIYRRRDATGRQMEFAGWVDGTERTGKVQRPIEERRGAEFDAGEYHRRLRSSLYGAPSVLVDDDYRILHVSKGADRYLRFPEGRPPETILEAARDRVETAIRTALFSAAKEGTESVRRHVPLEEATDGERITVRARPVSWDEEQLFHLLFEPDTVEPVDDEVRDLGDEEAEQTIRELEEELKETRRQLRATTEQYETTNEELRASNEELLSMNEELQSTTEELETSKEELESMNEELQTVNEELNEKVADLNEAYSDLENLMAATSIPTLFLTRQLTIRRFTPSAREVLNIRDSDVDRPIGDLTTKIEYDRIQEDARAAFEEERVRERTAELEEEVEERERLRREILRMADEERFRLGERLHDGIGQELAGIRMMCQAHAEVLEERGLEDLAEKARKIQNAVTDADRHTRGLAEEIVPVELEQGDIHDALAKLAQDIEELHDIRVDLEFVDGLDFEGSAATQVFRIVQEAVLNAVTHGNCESVGVRIVPEEERLLMEVTDDGMGPPGDLAAMKSEGMGIRIMEYRAGLLGGTIELDESDEGGTRMRVRIPEVGA